MQLVTFSIGLLASAAYAKVLEIQVGNPTAATDPEKLSFVPDVQKVDPGDTVRFVFNGNHTVTQQATFGACVKGTAAGGTPFDSGVKVKGQTFELPASALVPGSTINYYCKIKEGAHCRDPNNMQGAIFVSSAGRATTAKTGPSATDATTATNPKADASGKITGDNEDAGSKNRTESIAAATEAPPSDASAKITVEVGKDGKNVYSPSKIKAAPGATIVFKWGGGSKMHNVVPSDQPQSCDRSKKLETDAALKSLDSGAPQSSGTKEFVVPANATVGETLNFFCSVGTHCSADKMFGTITVTADVGDGGTPASTPPVAAADKAVDSTAGTANGDVGISTTDTTVESAESKAPPGTVRSDASVTSSSMAVFVTAVGAALMLA